MPNETHTYGESFNLSKFNFKKHITITYDCNDAEYSVQKLNPKLFTLQIYESNPKSNRGIEVDDDNKMKIVIEEKCIGYCDGSDLKIEPEST